MKNLKMFFILSLVFQTALYSQDEVAPTQEVYFDFHAATLDLCDNTKHVYLEFYTEPYYDPNNSVESKIESIEVFPTREPLKKHILKNVKEVEFFHLSAVENEIPFTVQAYNSRNERIFQKEIKVNTKKEEGVIDVSDKLNNYLDGFKGSKSSLFTHFCGKEISKVELLAFFQDFLGLTPEKICELIDIHNQVLGTPFENWESLDDGSILATILSCWLLEVYQTNITNGGGNGGPAGGGDDDCLCKLIRTKQSALNVQGVPNYSDQDECMNYDADVFAQNFDNKPNDNDHIFSQGRIGAAKAARMHIFYDGVDSSPTNFSTPLHQGWSTVRFRLVCVDPVTITPNLENCTSCNKQVEIEYGYYSKTFLTAHAYSCTLCTQGAWITIEDWAMLFATKNGEQQDSIIQGQRKFNAICDNPDEPAIDSVLTNTQSLVNSITTAIGSATTAQIFAAASAVVTFYQTTFGETLCDELNLDDYTLLSGQKQYAMEPGDELKFTIVSNATFGGRVKNHGEAIAQINSDFYLAAVLTTIPNEEGEVPEYCECEKIGAYVLGSLDTSTEDIPPVDETNNTNESNWSIVFDDPPFGLSTMQQLVGSFIGSFGPWPDAFETTNCCDVKINCMSDCVALVGCGENPTVGKVANTNLYHSQETIISEVISETEETESKVLSNKPFNSELRNKRSDLNNIRLYPNPLYSNEITVVHNDGFVLGTLTLFDMNGNLIYKSEYQGDEIQTKHNVELPDLQSGTYIILLTNPEGNTYWNKIIRL